MAKRDVAHTNVAVHSGVLSSRMRQGLWGRLGLTLACVSLATSLSVPLANAQVIKDPRAPITFQPKVRSSANGTPLVDITKPSFGGISHNKFQRYDIDTRGVILNNSKLGGTSIIGGRVTANPNLVGSRPARIILNEVTSAAASTLNGPTEVFGSKADVIIANPNGVGCVGCTFINSSRVTLSTGAPLPDYRRGTVSFDVEGGKISVAGQGLSSGGKKPLDAVNLIGRQIDVNGPVEAKEAVRLRAGGMVYNLAGDTAVAKDASQLRAITGPAIRSSAAGTIKADTISVISRDIDLGIKLDGKLEALTGEVAIRSSGDLSLASSYAKSDVTLLADGQVTLTGNNQALGRMSVSGKRVEVGLNGELTANDAVVLEALQSLATRGVLQAGNTISLVSGGELVAQGTIGANGEVMLEGRSLRTVDLKIGGGAVSVTGLDEARIDNTIIVAGIDSVKVAGQKVELGTGTAFDAVNRIIIDAKGDLINGTVLDYGNLDLSVRNTYTNAAGGQLALDNIVLSSSNKIVNAGILYGRISTLIEARTLSNTETGVIYGRDLTLKIVGDLTNLGQIVSDRTLSIVAGGSIANDNVVQAGGALTVTAAGYQANSAAAVLAGLTADLIVAGALENSGQILGERRITASAGSLTNRATGAINAGTNTLTIGGDILNEGTVGGVASLSITAHGHLNSPGSLLASEGNLTLTARAGKVTSGADVIAKGAVTIDAAAFDDISAGGRVSGSNVTIDVSGAFTSRGLVNAENALTVKAGTITVGPSAPQTDAGTLVAKTIELTSGGNLVNDGAISATGVATAPNLRLTAIDVQNNGTIVADDDLSLNASSYTATAQGKLGGKTLTVRLGNGSFKNLGLVSGSTLVDIRAGQLENGPTVANTNAGLILGGTIKLGGGASAIASVSNLGSIESGSDLTIYAGSFSNAGSMLAEKNGTLTANQVTNNGSITVGEALTIDAASYTAASSQALLSAKVTKLGTDTRHIQIDNAGKILGSSTVTAKASSLMNRGALSTLGGASANVMVDGALNNEGNIIGDNALTVTAWGTTTNSGRIVGVNDSLTLNAHGGVTNSGDILANTSVTLTAPWFSNASTNAKFGANWVTATITGSLQNYGLVAGATQLTLSANDILNGPSSGETIGVISGGAMALTIGSNLTNQGVLQTTNAGLWLNVPGTLSNTGKISANGDLQLVLPKGFANAGEMIASSLIKYSGPSYLGLAGSHLNATNIDFSLAEDFSNFGVVDAVAGLGISANVIANASGATLKASVINLDAKSSGVTNAGQILGDQLISIFGSPFSAYNLTNSGLIESLGDLNILAYNDVSNSGTLKANNLLKIETSGPTLVINGSGARIEAKTTYMNVAQVLNAGTIIGSDTLYIDASYVRNRGANASNIASMSGDKLTLLSFHEIDNDKNSQIIAGSYVKLNALKLSNGFLTNDKVTDGRFRFGGDLNITLTGVGHTFTEDLKVKGSFTFKVAGDLINYATVAASEDLKLTSTVGSVINGSNDPQKVNPGMFYAGNDLSINAHKDILNYASIIQAGNDITLTSKGQIDNTRLGIAANQTLSGPSLIQAGGSITATASDAINNIGSTISGAGGDVILTAVIKNLTVKSQLALIYAEKTVYTHGTLTDTGTIQGSTVVIDGKTVTIGSSGGNPPPKQPASTINLANALNLKKAGYSRGGGNVYDPASDATSGSVAGKDGVTIKAAVDARGKPITASGTKPVGTVKFLYAVPIEGTDERNPSWIFASVGADASNLTFFADPATERLLIQQSLLQQTGRGLLDPKYKNPKEQQEEFYQGTVEFLKANSGLKLGDNLTKDQRKKVTKPILWYTWKNVNGERVLVPELILPEKDLAKYAYTPGQGLVIGENVEITGSKVTNTGQILATENLTIDAKEFLNERKVIDGKLQTGGLVSAKDLYIETRKDITNRGGTMLAGDSLTLNARGNINIETQRIVTTTAEGFGKNWSATTNVKNIGAVVSSGGTLSMSAKKTIDIKGSTVTSQGDMNLIGKKGVTIAAAIDSVDSASGGKKSGFLKSSSFASNLATETNRGSVVSSSKGNVNIRTEKGDISVLGSHVSARNDVNLLAGYDADGKLVKGSKASVNIESVQDTTDSSFTQKKSGIGLFFGNGGFDIYRKTSTAGTTSIGTNVASSVSSKDGNVTMKAARDIDIKGSAVTAKKQITLDAKRDVNIDPGKHEAEQTFTKKVSGIGVHVSGDGGFGVQAGYHGSSASNGQAASRAARSILSGGEGISIHAGGSATIVAATIVSKKGQVKIDAVDDIKILAGVDTNRSYQSNKEVFAGLQLKVSQNVTGAMRQIAQTPGLAKSGYGNPAYQAIGAMSAALNLTQGVLSLTNPTVSASLTLGASGSKSHSEAWSNTAVGTTIKAESLVLDAGRNVHLQGVQATIKKDIAIDAGRHVTIESAQSYAGSSSSSSSWNVGVGVGGSCGAASGCTGGLYLEGGASQAKANNWSVTQLNSHLNAGGNLHIGSLKNTTIAGAVVTAATIDVAVKGNFTLASRQDTAHGSSSSSSVGGSLTIGLGTSAVSSTLNLGGGRSASDLAWVTEQTGLYAKDTLAVRVEKHTQVNGAVLNSDTGSLKLDTGTLGFGDIQDHDRATSTSGQIGVGIGLQQNGTGQTGEPSGTVSGSYASHTIEQVTKATVGEGTITIRDKDKQKQDVKDLNRDADTAQVITKNKRAGVQVYASTDAVKEIASGFSSIKQNLNEFGQAAAKGFSNVPQNIKNAIADAAHALNLEGRTVEETAGALVDQLVENGEIKPEDREKSKRAAVAAAKAAVEDPKASAQLGACAGKQSSLLHDLLFTSAHAEVLTTVAVGGACAAGPVVAAIALTAVVIGGIIYIAKSSDDDSTPAPFPDTPKTNPEIFDPIRGTPAKKNGEDGSIWEKDTSKHGGEQWKRWPDRKSWERGDTPTSVWTDGRIRK
jgi:filamentous hemagglutinin